MNLGRIAAVAKRIIAGFLHDHRTAALIFVVPIVILSLLGVLFKTDRVFDIGLVNQDQGITTIVGKQIFADKIADNLKNTKDLKWQRKDLEAAKADLTKGKLDAYVLLGEDFSQKLFSGNKPSVTISLEGSEPNSSAEALALINQSLADSFTSQKPVSIKVDYLYGGSNFNTLDYFAPVFIAFFAFMFVFLLTSVSFLRERTQGTIERLLASPVTNTEIVIGYFLGFLIFALVQSLVVLLFIVYILKVHFVGNVLNIFLIEMILVVGGVNLGIFLSTFAKNELQVIQFLPLVTVSQGLLSGLIWPIKSMPAWLQPIAQAMPLTYANDALRNIMIKGFDLTKVTIDILVLTGFALVLILLAAVTIRRGV